MDTSFNAKKIKESVTDTGIQKILLNHLSNNQDDPNLAFSPDGIDKMNKNLTALNDGKYHQPIYKVRVCEPQGNKFSVGTSGNMLKPPRVQICSLLFIKQKMANGAMRLSR